ncbi:hypothetical protein AX15_006626 [Amanita polypyramis BW_CC]|nr:hypothetical protein AX15_006626 [Amanita polypyramis BW_CC]
MLAIAQSIPSEIIREILKHFSAHLEVHHSKAFPWFLGHVCSLWRTEFLSMKQEFWRKIILTTGADSDVTLVEMFLERNRGLPFSFKLSCHEPHPVLDRLVAESARWEDVEIRVLREDLFLSLMPIKGHLPLLRSLSSCLSVTPAEEVGGKAALPDSCQDIFMNAPYLTRLTLFHISTWRFKWSSLTYFELIDSVSNPVTLDVFPLMENLEKLVVGEVYCEYQGFITMPRLESLAINRGYKFLNILRTPLLKQLYLKITPQDARYMKSCPAACISFIQRSSCRLQHLEIPRCDVAMLEEVLPYSPEIGHLSLLGSADILKFLRRSSNLSLKSLRIHAVLPSEHYIKALPDLAAVNQLQELIVSFPGHPHISRDAQAQLRSQCSAYGIQFKAEFTSGLNR